MNLFAPQRLLPGSPLLSRLFQPRPAKVAALE